MDRRVARGALRLRHVGLVVTAGHARGQFFTDACVALEAKLPDLGTLQHFRIG